MSPGAYRTFVIVLLLLHGCGGGDSVADTAPSPDTSPVGEVTEDPCARTPCGAGTCASDGAGGYRCACPEGAFFDGASCASCAPIADCTAVRCTSGQDATCTACGVGFVPSSGGCVDFDPCAGDPCGQGECQDLGDRYRCACDDGYYEDGGTCAGCPSVAHCEAWACTSASDSACTRCEAGWDNDDGVCREPDPCAGDPCGAGECVASGAGDYRCECAAGDYDDGTRCARCPSVAHCTRWACTSGDDSRCLACATDYVDDGAGGCELAGDRCSDVKTLAIGDNRGDTRGARDDASGCTLPIGEETFVVGEGAEDETWFLQLSAQTLVTLTVTGFDAGIYVLSGNGCASADLIDEACVDFEAGDSETYSGVLDAGKYWVLVDGFAFDGETTGGPYTIRMDAESPCEDGSYATATSCRACPAVAGCTLASCTNASDATCLLCDEGYAMTAAGECVVPTCDLVLEPGVVAYGNTLGKRDDSAACDFPYSDGSTYVVGAGAEDEVWSLVLAERSLVTITVTGFDAAIYLQRGPSCAGGALNETACTDFDAGDSEVLYAILEAGQHWVVVDGYADGSGSTGGPYEIAVELADPCGEVSPRGVCDGANISRWCIVPPAGISFAATASTGCDDDEVCREIAGVSRCFPSADAATCDRAMAFCDGDTIVWCEAPGPLARAACPNGCRSRWDGAFCAPALGTETFAAKVDYEYRLPNAGLTDWSSERRLAPLRGATVYSWHWNGVEYEFVDSALTEHDGRFEIQVASPPSPDDVVQIAAMRTKPLSMELSFAIAEPDVGEGEQPIDGVAEGAVYTWFVSATESDSELYIPEEDGSGALRLFDVMSLVYENTAELYYRDVEPKSVVVWMRIGTTWSCGECHWRQFTDAIGDPMETQMFVPASALDQSYWADAVTLHEAGHWTMAAFGSPPNEGGPHFFGHAYFPGLAWSEGWATWLSSDWRGDSLYLDKQDGSMFWIDIGDRTSASASEWPRPEPSDGLLGRMYELEVSAMLWQLSLDPEITPNALYLTLGAPRAQLPLRGYTRHSWELDEDGEPVDVIDSGLPAVMFADFLDALVCSGEPADIAARVDRVTEPDNYYAYPSAEPICEAGGSTAPPAAAPPAGHPERHGVAPPLVLELVGPAVVKPHATVTLVAHITRAAGVTAPLVIDVTLPAGTRLVGGKDHEIVQSAERVVTRVFEIAIDAVPSDDVQVLASSGAATWGARALRAYRFGRAEPQLAPPVRTGPELQRGSVRFGRPIPLRRR